VKRDEVLLEHGSALAPDVMPSLMGVATLSLAWLVGFPRVSETRGGRSGG
jgi:hypothetical protein